MWSEKLERGELREAKRGVAGEGVAALHGGGKLERGVVRKAREGVVMVREAGG